MRVVWPESHAGRTGLLGCIESCAPYCGMVLLDAGSGGGGQGVSIPAWMIRDFSCSLPWMLAGGLNRDSLDAVQALPEKARPAGLDFNSGLESAPGCKDEIRMRNLMARAGELMLCPDMPEMARMW